MKKENRPIIAKLVKETVNANDIQPGRIIHKKLSPELEERIRRIEPVFAEVYPKSHSEWMDGFQRDLDPESEIRLWEAMASTYQAFLTKHTVIKPAKKEALRLLVTAAGTVDETLSRTKLSYLNRKEAEELLRLYSAALSDKQQPFSGN